MGRFIRGTLAVVALAGFFGVLIYWAMTPTHP